MWNLITGRDPRDYEVTSPPSLTSNVRILSKASLTKGHPASVWIPPRMRSWSPFEAAHSILAVLIVRKSSLILSQNQPLEMSLHLIPVLPSEATPHLHMFQDNYSAPHPTPPSTYTHKHQVSFHGMWFGVTAAFSHHFGFSKFNAQMSWLLVKLCV